MGVGKTFKPWQHWNFNQAPTMRCFRYWNKPCGLGLKTLRNEAPWTNSWMRCAINVTYTGVKNQQSRMGLNQLASKRTWRFTHGPKRMVLEENWIWSRSEVDSGHNFLGLLALSLLYLQSSAIRGYVNPSLNIILDDPEPSSIVRGIVVSMNRLLGKESGLSTSLLFA